MHYINLRLIISIVDTNDEKSPSVKPSMTDLGRWYDLLAKGLDSERFFGPYPRRYYPSY